MALALYRRYRPDTFDKVIGQDQVTVPLSRALDHGRLTHAYLFSGPRGCGKTSSARILARCINCVKGPTSHPCGECESCKDLANGGPGSIDVVEIDAASHNGVEDARELRERATFAPARDRYKIFILDEAHMVTQQGFNALLKIVEEPPEHVMFIFATTEPDKVIGTIRSRTHHYPFRLVPQEIMGPFLEGICKKEQISCEPGVLRLTMRAGGGSVRDTLSILDQLMVGSVDGVISYDVAVSLLGFTPDTLIAQAIDAVVDRNGEQLYGVVQKVVVGGFDPRRFVEDLLARVRDLLVLTIGGERAENVLSDDAAAEDLQQLHRQAAALGLHALSAMAETINTALAGMNGAVSPRMRLELLAARLLAGRELPSDDGRSDAVAHSAPGGAQHAGETRGFVGVRHDGITRPSSSPERGDAHTRSSSTTVSDHPVPQTQVPSTPASAPAKPLPPQTPAGHERHDGDASNNPRADTSGVDERWGAVLDMLPQDVREYIEHDKVVKVALVSNGSGRQRLDMTFDCALSQHAFALAVCSDAAHNGDKAASVVLRAAREVFGASTMIAPTKIAANGERVEPTSHMAPQQLIQVKRQIALAKAGTAAAGLVSTAVQERNYQERGRGKETKTSGPRKAGDADDASADHHAAGGGVLTDEDDPWYIPIAAAPIAKDGAPAPASLTARPAANANEPESEPRSSRVEHPGDGHARPAGHHKAVAVPDMTDEDDPWAIADGSVAPGSVAPESVPSESEASKSTGTASDATARGPRSSSVPPSTQSLSNAAPSAMRADAADGTPSTARPEIQSATSPRVAAEDDEYSLNDESLDSATGMDIAEIEKLFDVKKVEDFAADDPRNPKNAQPANKHQEG